MHAVDVEKVRQYVHQHGLIRADLLHGGEHVFDAGADVALLVGFAGGLLAVFQKRQAEHQPPYGGDGKDDGQTCQHRHADSVHDEEDQQRDGGAADVAQAVAKRGDGIHAVLGGDISQKGVVINAGGVKADGA